MNININSIEIEQRHMMRRYGEKKYAQIESSCRQNELVGITGVPVFDGNRYSCAILTECETVEDNHRKVEFIPLHTRCFVTMTVRPPEIRMITLEIDGDQWSFTKDGVEKTHHTLSGPGCDPNDVAESELMLKKLIGGNGPKSDALQRVLNFFKEYAKEKQPKVGAK